MSKRCWAEFWGAGGSSGEVACGRIGCHAREITLWGDYAGQGGDNLRGCWDKDISQGGKEETNAALTAATEQIGEGITLTIRREVQGCRSVNTLAFARVPIMSRRGNHEGHKIRGEGAGTPIPTRPGTTKIRVSARTITGAQGGICPQERGRTTTRCRLACGDRPTRCRLHELQRCHGP